MKKIIFLFVMVFAVSFAMAQHTDVVNQTGDNNVAYVDQSFMANPGPGLPGNEAFVDQIGNSNKADVDQLNNGYAGAAHWAKVWSQGNSNTAKIFQENHGGDALISQLGSTNWADIFQTGNFNVGSPADANYDAVAVQTGNSNVVTIDVWGTNATAYALQNGENNNIDQDLGSAYGEKVEDSHFIARQYGNSNTAIQMMEGQGFSGGITAVNNYGEIYQQGNSNTAKQYMLEDVVLGPAANNWAKATQIGSSNWSEQYQTGDGNTSTHFQSGNNNVEITHQN